MNVPNNLINSRMIPPIWRDQENCHPLVPPEILHDQGTGVVLTGSATCRLAGVADALGEWLVWGLGPARRTLGYSSSSIWSSNALSSLYIAMSINPEASSSFSMSEASAPSSASW